MFSLPFSNKTIDVSGRTFPLKKEKGRASEPIQSRQKAKNFPYQRGAESKPPMGRFVICQFMGYIWAKKKGIENEELAKALGYALAIIPNCVKKGWAMGWSTSGHPQRSKPKIAETYEEYLIQNAEDRKRFSFIDFGRWDFIIDNQTNKACSANFRYNGKIEWWGADNFERYARNKLTPEQQQKLIELINKEWEQIDEAEIGYKYCKQYKNFWQKTMDKLGNLI